MGLGEGRKYIVRGVPVVKGTTTPPPTNFLFPSSTGQGGSWAVYNDHHQEEDKGLKNLSPNPHQPINGRLGSLWKTLPQVSKQPQHKTSPPNVVGSHKFAPLHSRDSSISSTTFPSQHVWSYSSNFRVHLLPPQGAASPRTVLKTVIIFVAKYGSTL